MNKNIDQEATPYEEDLRTLAEYKREDRQRENSLHFIMSKIYDLDKNKSVSIKPIKWMQIVFFTCAFAAVTLLVFISLDDRDWNTYYQAKFSGDADISGVIFTRDDDSIYIFVANHLSKNNSKYDVEYYRIRQKDSTIFLDENGMKMEKEDLTLGNFVRVWVKGDFTSKYVSEGLNALEDEDIPTYTATAIQLQEITLEEMYERLLSNKEGKYKIHVFLRESVDKEAVQNELNPLVVGKYRTFIDSIAYYYDHFEEYEAIGFTEEMTIIITDMEIRNLITSDLKEVVRFFDKLEKIKND